MKLTLVLITALLLMSSVSAMIAEANATSDAGIQVDMTIPALDSRPHWDPRLDQRRP
ncbi:MAG: conotoxin [Rhodocyclaceae bacterium]|nr:conotoxin [Rhodocyclaceae bacterium]